MSEVGEKRSVKAKNRVRVRGCAKGRSKLGKGGDSWGRGWNSRAW